jgi:hypothetical protein
VAEIYQNLVPYRTHRAAIGVEMNGDYEDALMRLLAGEGGFLTLESEVAQSELVKELSASNPNTTLYRDFAAATVRLNPDRLAEAGTVGAEGSQVRHEEPDEPPMPSEEEEILVGAGEETPLEVSIADLAPSPEAEPEDDSSPEDSGPEEQLEEDLTEEEGPALEDLVGQDLEPAETLSPEEPQTHGGPVAAIPPSAESTEHCRRCDEVLPEREGLNFCPFCGTDQRLVPCGSCGEEMEPHWRFCVSCGSSMNTD